MDRPTKNPKERERSIANVLTGFMIPHRPDDSMLNTVKVKRFSNFYSIEKQPDANVLVLHALRALCCVRTKHYKRYKITIHTKIRITKKFENSLEIKRFYCIYCTLLNIKEVLYGL